MNVLKGAISLNVHDVDASARFAMLHFGFEIEMSSEGFASLRNEAAGFNLVFLRTGLESFRPVTHAGSAGRGILVVFEVTNADAEHDRIVSEGAAILTPLQTEPWGQRFFQVSDPNGIVYEVTHWPTPLPER
jgi:predicted enzyme related to lactoylglutathione lyase